VAEAGLFIFEVVYLLIFIGVFNLNISNSIGQRKIHTIAYIINYSLVTDALVKERTCSIS